VLIINVEERNEHYCVNQNIYFCNMENSITIIKGIHPGFVLDRALKERQIPKGKFAISLNEFPQTIVTITKGKRRMNINLALKIEHALDLNEGYLMTLQVFYDIKEEKKKLSKSPDLSKLRTALFWDTKIDQIDWS
jgi:plasmid maintenance system antidote protein VapI